MAKADVVDVGEAKRSITFGRKFYEDMGEAFLIWKVAQIKIQKGQSARKELEAFTFHRWIAVLLKKPVYDILGEARALEE